MSFHIVPIEESIAKEVRGCLTSPGYGHPAWTEVAGGKAPCRLCLTYITPGKQRLIGFSYDAFHSWEDLPLPGPIFVHEQECAPYAATDQFPEQLRGSRYVLDAYRRGRTLIEERTVDGADADESLESLLANPDVDYVHVRSVSAGCFQFAAVRP